MMEPCHVLDYDCRKADGTSPEIVIGDYCSVGRNVTFCMAHHDPSRVSTTPAPSSLFAHRLGNASGFSRGDVRIGSDVWIGANATIMDNVAIGHGAVVAAASVVTRDVPPYAIVAGNPARVIRKRFSEEQVAALLEIRWWDEDRRPDDIWTQDVDGFIRSRARPS